MTEIKVGPPPDLVPTVGWDSFEESSNAITKGQEYNDMTCGGLWLLHSIPTKPSLWQGLCKGMPSEHLQLYVSFSIIQRSSQENGEEAHPKGKLLWWIKELIAGMRAMWRWNEERTEKGKNREWKLSSEIAKSSSLLVRKHHLRHAHREKKNKEP